MNLLLKSILSYILFNTSISRICKKLQQRHKTGVESYEAKLH